MNLHSFYLFLVGAFFSSRTAFPPNCLPVAWWWQWIEKGEGVFFSWHFFLVALEMSIGGMRRFIAAGGCSGALSSSPAALVSGANSPAGATLALMMATRGRFYRPLVNQGINLWRYRMGRIHKGWCTWEYQHTRPDPRPFPDPPVNDYFGRSRIWNPISGKMGYVNKKAEEWGWPHQRPPPTGLRRSQEYFPFFLRGTFLTQR
ncbi:hypothetical protein MOQ_006372 [Trypanosoma cruzi marinkellei]|uniref:Secreted protein n=1 Tax=Trypanosoma cruzi marinkellei TaxID=85056 RepID=K2M4D0_TRYCR|nr:hypothetical protein MOQ_006372 [Trypanosoma cruzi marinkellei]